jgi:hypothetical protein
MLYDSLAVALDHPAVPAPKEEGKPPKGMAKKMGGDVREQFRRFFHAEADDDAGVVEDYTHGIPQVLRLMNARQINDTSSVVTKLTQGGATPEKVIEGLYLRVLSRTPTQAETARMTKYVASEKDKAKGYADVMWVLLNSGEFLFIH